MLTISQLYIYPVKSLAGIAVDSAIVTSRGLQHDRRLMLTDSANRFLTQREYPVMALLQPVLAANGLYIHHKKNQLPPLFIPEAPVDGQPVIVTVWDDCCGALPYDTDINDWFSQALGFACQLVYMPESSQRAADKKYAHNNEIVSFADGYPTLLIGQASLDDLNSRLTVPVPMNRFRPNIVFTGGAPFLEDQLAKFNINGIEFSGVKPCARCVMTTIDQENPAVSKEPLKTLAAYRQKNNKILFGQNLVHRGEGSIRVGDSLEVMRQQPPAILHQ